VNVTICIITRNRPGELAECLKSVAASSVRPGEIVVSDDSTDQLTRELVTHQFPHVKYVDGPRQGLGPNRNSAIAAASGEWILFLDDDARLGSDFLATLIPIIASNSGRRVIFSGIEHQETGPIFPRSQDFLGFQTRKYSAVESLNTLVINAALFPAKLLKTLQFDARLIYGYDEVDIAARARAVGWEILLCPKAVNYHYPSATNRDYYRPHTETARIYVTFKIYYAAQRKPLKAAVFLMVSLLHSIGHHLKRKESGGPRAAIQLHRNAWHLINVWRKEIAHRPTIQRLSDSNKPAKADGKSR
jgi:GT2 family glycosyltransferase